MPDTVSRAAALQKLTLQFREAGIDTAALDARLLIMEVAQLTPAELYTWPDKAIEPAALVRLSSYAQRRINHEPVARILGKWEFWGLPFYLSPATLVPRPETETLVEAAIIEYQRIAHEGEGKPVQFVDIGTGTGCIAAAVASECPEAYGIAVDLSPEAAAMAHYNIELNNISSRVLVLNGSWTSMLRANSIDLILSNPPYIESSDIDSLEADVRDYDPHLALDGGVDGLVPYREIFKDAKRILRRSGAIIVEFGEGQASMVAAIARQNGFCIKSTIKDFSGIERIIVACNT